MQHVAGDRLQVEIDLKKCEIPGDERARLQSGIERIGEAVSDFLSSQLWMTIVFHPRTQVYHAQAKLKVPGETIITGEQDAYFDAAVMRCIDKVIRRVEAYKANPDRAAIEQAKRQSRLATDIIAPVEANTGAQGQAVARADYPAFRHALLSYEEWVRMRVGRWIQRYPGLEDEIGRSLEIADLVEEVFLTAFDQYPSRPTHLSMHEWLDSLIDPAVRSFWYQADERQAVSFAQSLTERPGSPGSASNGGNR